jgi:hypothetical protein
LGRRFRCANSAFFISFYDRSSFWD